MGFETHLKMGEGANLAFSRMANAPLVGGLTAGALRIVGAVVQIAINTLLLLGIIFTGAILSKWGQEKASVLLKENIKEGFGQIGSAIVGDIILNGLANIEFVDRARTGYMTQSYHITGPYTWNNTRWE